MKNKFFMLICATLLCGSIGAQKITVDKVPAPVASAFKSKFPTVTKANWKMEDGKNYVADFSMNNTIESAKFNSSGGWMKTNTSVKVTEIPVVVKDNITKLFAGYAIGSASKMENADHGNGYEVMLSKGTESIDVVLSSKGVVMSQEPRTAESMKTTN